MIIALTGLPGAGKTTLATLLAKTLSIPWYSMGDIRGHIAKEHNLTIDEFNALGEKEAFTDTDVDAYQTELGKSGESFVIDGRLSWYFIPSSFKIFLQVDPLVGAQRIFSSQQKKRRSDERVYASVEETKNYLEQRVASDGHRYKKYYNVDIMDTKHYDLLLDSTQQTPKQLLAHILRALPQERAH